MELYKPSDLELGEKNIPKIIEEIEQVRKQLYPRPNDNEPVSDAEPAKKKEPLLEDVKAIVKIVLDFVKEKKRKIYGGTSHNSVIKAKNKADAFYSEEVDISTDIDVYSPTPIEDLVELCDTLYNNGFTDAISKQAMHGETYKIFTRGYNAVDISYVPKIIYDNIPFIEIENIRYTHPSFAMIDLYRILSEPLFSNFKWEKVFKRIKLLQKHYPFQKMPPEIPKVYSHKGDISNVRKTIENFITNNESVYLFGDVAYNCIINESGNTNKSIKPVEVGIYHIVSTNYKIDALGLIREFKNDGIKITFKEYYPFWTLTGHSVEIIYNGNPIARVYHNMKRCCPTIKASFGSKPNDFVQIGSFDYIFLMEMVLSFRQKVLRDQNKKRYHDTIISNLIMLREEYFKKNKLTLFDPSVFQSFVIPCVGRALDPIMEAKKQRKEKKEKNMTMFMYKPIREIKTKWVFSNTSGNEIHNPKNFKLRTNKNEAISGRYNKYKKKTSKN